MVKKNIIANFLGSAWMGLMALAFIPSYISLMGSEAFALIGLFIALANLLSALDFGISPTLNRELAACSVNHAVEKMRNTLRTFEVVYFIIILLVIAGLVGASSYVAESWLQNNQLSTKTVAQSLQLMAVVIALHLLTNFYSAGLAGLQYQIQVNTVNAVMATLRYAAIVPLMHTVSASPVFFFIWQLLIGLLHLLTIMLIIWRKIPASTHRPVFQKDIIHAVWKFSAGVSIISIMGLVLVQLDRIFLSHWLSLETFGYYSVASIIAMSIAPRIASPFFAALYPRLTQYFKQGEEDKSIALYHNGCFMLALILIPLSLFIALYAQELLWLWTSDHKTVNNAASTLTLLALGCLFHGMMYIPYALQLAHARIKIALYLNIISLCIAVPLMLILYTNHGANGVAFTWFILNAFSTLIGVFMIHRHLLKGEYKKWLLYDNGPVFIIALLPAVAARLLFYDISLIGLLLILCMMFFLPVVLISTSRSRLVKIFQGHFSL
ncbi:oligosaccharide flippase family protein [Candidatus Venteria ishoeyi]|uniref:oligosaccharide flippase family protein n=1 Tax=Candidatus Venteria ishoeyi TaxID=1899563 RepID=UPI0025A666A0|nr:oligosaccharide flippase family protein [Candidatus Venteria ishoeyi]MDM8546570.1 oligosaccharide flippase family protein [Candidatus Venteria ishoeyi]